MDPVRILFDVARLLPRDQQDAAVRREAKVRGFDTAVIAEANELLALRSDATLELRLDPDATVDEDEIMAFAARLRRAFDRDPDPAVSFGADDVADRADSRLLENLKTRGPSSSRYSVSGVVGKGAMGKVYRVYDKDLRRELAMKVMLGDDLGKLERFVEEAQVTGQLDHPGIVPIHEIGLDKRGRVYFTMKLVQGSTLKDVIAKVGAEVDDWTVTRTVGVLQRVCEAMAFAHSKGVVHRDLKPSNIMVGKFGEVFVMDFGLSRVLPRPSECPADPEERGVESVVRTERRDRNGPADSTKDDASTLTREGTAVGTPCYMPPEQAAGDHERVGFHSDVYAIGAILYHLLTGAPPYAAERDGATAETIVERVIEGPPPSLARCAPDAPPELVAITERAMARDIDRRYASMTELASELRAYLEGRVVTALETGPIAELKMWMRRNPLLASASVALFVVLASATWIVSYQKTEIARQSGIAESKARLAETAAATAQAEKQRVMRLADMKQLEELKLEMPDLLPAEPSNVAKMEAWLARAKQLAGRVQEHEATLADLRSRGVLESHPRQLELYTLRGELAAASNYGITADEIHVLEARIAALTNEVSSKPNYSFHGDSESEWWHANLTNLVDDLRAFASNDRHADTIACVESNLAFARSVERMTIDDHRREWATTIAAIHDDPRYGGLALEPQIGLVPLGRDPSSGLFEFWHLESGETPRRDARGEIEVRPETGIVFVLVPGGKFFMGAQSDDKSEPNYDGSARDDEHADDGLPVEVALEPFFVAKYELTQGQWLRLAGKNPSQFPMDAEGDGGIERLVHPVEQVSWNDCRELLGAHGLDLPTEAQWEYAARAGTATAWWIGDDSGVLDRAGNLADSTALEVESWKSDHRLNDGCMLHTAVGAFAPNRFGLYDVVGNVMEWCKDAYVSYATPAHYGDGLRGPTHASRRALRGGAYSTPPDSARSAFRGWGPPTIADAFVGVRAARAISKPAS